MDNRGNPVRFVCLLSVKVREGGIMLRYSNVDINESERVGFKEQSQNRLGFCLRQK